MGKKSPISLSSSVVKSFKFYTKGVKNKVVVFCLLQALVCTIIGLYIIAYLPHLVLDDDTIGQTVATSANDPALERKKTEQKLAKLSSSVAFEKFTYTLFRYNQFHNGDELATGTSEDMVNEYGEYAYFVKDDNEIVEESPGWFPAQTDYCNGCFVVYGKRVIHLKDVSINPSFGYGKEGGEEIDKVMNQDAQSEVYRTGKGYFMMESETVFTCNESLAIDLFNFVSALIVKKPSSMKLQRTKVIEKYAVLTVRYEFANFYHTTMNWYDMFLIMVLFRIDPKNLDTIWMDSHPKSKLDDAWQVLFGKAKRAGSIKSHVTYRNMIWNGFGSRSHINQHKINDLPFAEEYRHFVLSRYDITDDHVLDCGKIRITIIWRRDHVAHPRNPTGFITRKTANEEEIWRAVKQADYSAIVNGAQLDELPMEDQLDLMVKTDILIGAHGAGLSHILYLPKTSGVIELYPQYTSVSNSHFRAMSKWRRLSYMTWSNQDMTLEQENHRTYIPPSLIEDMVKTMKKSICKKKNEL